MKIGVGTGDFVVLHVGGVVDRWEFLVSGPAFLQAFTALDHATPGQVVVSLRAWSHVNTQLRGRQLQMGSVLLEAAGPTTPPVGRSEIELADAMALALHTRIPAAVTARLAAGQENWLGELRVVSVLFVSLPELNYATPLDRAQQAMRYLQTEIDRFEGSLNKLNVDDKGTSLLAAMGMPPLAHEDDAKRAVQAAMAMQRKLGEMGLRTSIGISTGRVFCGSIGNPRRREYTLLGDVVNLGARLMQVALGDVLCDEATFHMTRSRLEFERLPNVMIKGKTEPVTVYRPFDGRRPVVAPKVPPIGRLHEREVLRKRVQDWRREERRQP